VQQANPPSRASRNFPSSGYQPNKLFQEPKVTRDEEVDVHRECNLRDTEGPERKDGKEVAEMDLQIPDVTVRKIPSTFKPEEMTYPGTP
jgi:hypothetical protein